MSRDSPVYEALRKIAYDERVKIHDVVIEGIDAALRRRGYPSIDNLKGKKVMRARPLLGASNDRDNWEGLDRCRQQVLEDRRTGRPRIRRHRSSGSRPGRGPLKAIGINRAESMWRQDDYIEPVKFPAGLGYEAAGVVDAVVITAGRAGGGISRLGPTRIWGFWSRAWRSR
jgi:hypothetical protein